MQAKLNAKVFKMYPVYCSGLPSNIDEVFHTVIFYSTMPSFATKTNVCWKFVEIKVFLLFKDCHTY